MLKKIFLLLLIGSISQTIISQVGINTESPNPLTALDVNVLTNNGEVTPRGIMVPRMTQTQRDAIDVSNADNANSLLVYNITEDCFNYFSKIRNIWVSMCGAPESPDATFSIDCSEASVEGNYMVNNPLSSSNYITLTVTVTKAGNYNISAFPDTDNGYYFSAIGEFVRPGSYKIKVSGYGTPLNSNDAGDQLIVQNNDETICDNLLVKINSAKFTLDCNSIVISGDYIATVPLTANNTLKVTLTVDPSLEGYEYETTTDI